MRRGGSRASARGTRTRPVHTRAFRSAHRLVTVRHLRAHGRGRRVGAVQPRGGRTRRLPQPHRVRRPRERAAGTRGPVRPAAGHRRR